MTRDRFLERQVEKLTDERDSFHNGQMQLQAINSGLQDSIAKYAAERKVLRELVDGAMDVVEIFPVTFPAQKEWKAEWLRKAREIFQPDGMTNHEKWRKLP